MADFNDRQKAFENKFARDAELQFKVTARRNRLVGEWAAAKMGKSDDDIAAYAKEVVEADFEEAGDEDVIRKLLADFQASDTDVDDAAIREALEENMNEARRQFIEEDE
ncbi:MAG: DUF1476 domain-containing protein [Parasphingorhabdus sp.]